MTGDNEKAARKFLKEADDFVAGKRKKYPMGSTYLDSERFPHRIERGSKLSSLLKEPAGGKIRRLLTAEQKEYLRETIRGNWTDLFVLYSINRKESSPAAYWEKMALALAEQHVPSFRTTSQPPKRKRLQPGAPPKRSQHRDATLVMHIRNLQANLKAKGLPCSVLEAAKTSLKFKLPRWKTAKGWMKPKSIASEFHAARRRLTAEHKKGGMSLAALAALMPKP